MNGSFKTAAAQNYFASEAFMARAEQAIKFYITENKMPFCVFSPGVVIDRVEDGAQLEAAFAVLQRKYPALDHFRLNTNGTLILDTQPKPTHKPPASWVVKKIPLI